MRKKINLIGIFCCILSLPMFGQFKKYTFETGKMGSPFNIIVSTTDSSGLHVKIQQAFELAEELENQLSDYRENSDVSRVNQLAGTGKFYPIQKPFRTILVESLYAKKISSGRLNVFAGKLVHEWRKARRTKMLPDAKTLAQISKEISQECVEFSTDSLSIRLLHSSCQLDFGSIGKGFVAQEVLNFLVKSGFPYVLVDAGGKIVCTQVNESGENWKIGLEMPQSKNISNKLIKANNVALASSGNTYQVLSLDGKLYSHVLDATTGWAVEHSRSATVVCKDGARADWLATAATLLSIEQLKEIMDIFKDIKILVWQNNADKLDIIFNHNIL